VKAKNPEAYLVGEFWGTDPHWTGAGGRFDGLMNYPLMSAILRFVAAGRIDFGLANTTCLDFQPIDAHGFEKEVRHILEVYPEATLRANLNLLGSHDLPRLLSLVGGHRSAVRLAAALLFTFPGAPCIYYGDEIGMTGGPDPGCRGAFPWEHESAWDHDLLENFRSLVALRHREDALRLGDYRHFYADGGFYAFARQYEGDRLMVAINAGDGAAGYTTESPGTRAEALWGEGQAELVDGRVRVDLPARSAGVWRI
jgi:cyclomaltodextrinase